MKELFLVVYLMASPNEGGNFGGALGDGFSYVKTFKGENALVECVDMIYQINANWPSRLNTGKPTFYCVPAG